MRLAFIDYLAIAAAVTGIQLLALGVAFVVWMLIAVRDPA